MYTCLYIIYIVLRYRFADVMGLDLVRVKFFDDSLPITPLALPAFQDLVTMPLDLQASSPTLEPTDSPSLVVTDSSIIEPSTSPTVTDIPPEIVPTASFLSNCHTPLCFCSPTLPLFLLTMFTEPINSPSFLSQVEKCGVCMERLGVESVTSRSATLVGEVRVKNLEYVKSVMVRWSCDGWKTYGEVEGIYLNGDGVTDRFNFRLQLDRLTAGERLEMCVRFHCGGRDYWDNNENSNYVFQVRK